MRFVIKMKTCALATLAALSLAGAQGTFRMRTGFSPLPLLRNPAAQAELSLTPAQRARIDAAMPNVGPGRSVRVGPGEAAGVEEKVKKILTPAQLKRLDELVIQYHAPMIALRDDVARKIGLTADQRERMETVRNGEFRKAAMASGMANGNAIRIGPEVIRRVNGEVAKVLTPAQRSALVRLGGKPVKLR